MRPSKRTAFHQGVALQHTLREGGVIIVHQLAAFNANAHRQQCMTSRHSSSEGKMPSSMSEGRPGLVMMKELRSCCVGSSAMKKDDG